MFKFIFFPLTSLEMYKVIFSSMIAHICQHFWTRYTTRGPRRESGWRGWPINPQSYKRMYIFQFSVLGSEENQILSIKILSLIFFSLLLQIFDGNCDHFTPVVNILEHGIKARYVRFYPVTYNYVCMRVEVYGCDA